MQRVTKGQTQTLVLATPKPVSSGTLTVTRDRDATVVVNAQNVTLASEEVTYPLPAQTGEANLTAVWTLVNADGTQTVSERIEVCSSRTVSLDELRRYKPLDDVRRYPSSLLDRARTSLENELDEAAGVSFTGKEFTVRVDGSGTTDLFLPVGRPRSISSVTVEGAALSATDLAALIIDERGGVVINPVPWRLGRANIVITGICGYQSAPGQVPFAVSKGVRYMLVDSPITDRAISTTNEDGTTSSLVVAGLRGAMFSIPELNSVISQYGTNFGLA